MTDDEDDYPVLTEVLRTRTGRFRPPSAATATPEPSSGEPTEAVEPLLPPQLVVGHDAQADLQHYADHDGNDEASPAVAASNEVLFEPIVKRPTGSPDDAPVAPSVPSTDYFTHPDEPLPSPAPSGLAIDADAFALQVREAVLEDLATRVDTELDARIAQALHSELEVALAHLQDGLRENLALGLRDVVHRAVDDAIARLRSPAR